MNSPLLSRASHSSKRGMTFIDVIIGTAVMLLVFVSLFGAFKLSIELVYNTKAKTGGVALVTERIEYIRSLPYESVGTVGGIPSGTIDQLEQISLNGITYTLRTLVQYVDAPEDGLDTLDENGITADYKSVKVEALWTTRGNSRSTFAVTRISPTGIESLSGGGTLRVNVFDALTNPVAAASVRIENATLSPAIDVTVSTNSQGTVAFPGAPEGAGYKITVTKTGYSTAGTYDASVSNPNPNPGHVAVVVGQTTTSSFAIDLLGSLSVRTFEPIGPGNFSDTLSDDTKLAATTSVRINLGELVLEDTAGVFELAGSARTLTVEPNYLSSWDEATISYVAPPGTDVRVHVYYDTGTSALLVPDSDLAGNSAGFTAATIDLSQLDVATYPKLKLDFSLVTSDDTVTPRIDEWGISYLAGPTPLPDVPFRLRSTKVIGDTGSGPIFKVDVNETTDGDGIKDFVPIEWDTYAVTPDAATYDIAERCPNSVSVSPNESLIANFILESNSAHSLKVYVEGTSGALSGANVNISGGSVNDTETTSSCGQVFFGSMPAGTYTLTISHGSYQTHVESGLSVTGNAELSATLVP